MGIGLVSPLKGTRYHSNVTATGTATQLVAANLNRKSVTFQNQGSNTVFLAKATVTTGGTTRGYALFTGTSFTDNGSADEWFGVTAGTSEIVHVVEIS